MGVQEQGDGHVVEDGHKACHPFWPNNEGDTAPMEETPYDSFFTRKFLIYDDKIRPNDSPLVMCCNCR